VNAHHNHISSNNSPAWLLLKQPWHIITFGAGSGLIKLGPGTWGTLVGVLCYWPMSTIAWYNYVGLAIAFTLLGVVLCQQATRALEVVDHPAIVWDEIVGFYWAMLGLANHWAWIIAAFVIFRVLDALKPWPISWLEKRFPNGIGIMLDDVAAGLVTCLLLNGIHFIL